MNLTLVTKDSKESSEIVLKLACAAQRFNNDYIKTGHLIHITLPDETIEHISVFSNASLILKYLGYYNKYHAFDKENIPNITIEQCDVEMAHDIKDFYKYLAFEVMSYDSNNVGSFKTKVNELLLIDTMPLDQLGFIACLPSVYLREKTEKPLKKIITSLDNAYIGVVDEKIYDKECLITVVSKSKNFDAYNVTGIIDNKLVCWMSKKELLTGTRIIKSAKIKSHNTHWKFGNKQTQLNYVILK